MATRQIFVAHTVTLSEAMEEKIVRIFDHGGNSRMQIQDVQEALTDEESELQYEAAGLREKYGNFYLYARRAV